MRKRNKFGAKKTVIDGITFDSKKEAEHYKILKIRLAAKQIKHLARQVIFRLEINGMLICKYVADFTYVENGRLVVDEVKGFETAVWKLKKKLFQALNPKLELRITR